MGVTGRGRSADDERDHDGVVGLYSKREPRVADASTYEFIFDASDMNSK